MKVREKLMRKVMAVVIAAATIFSISGGTKVVPVKAAVEVAEVLDNTGMRISGYTTLSAAFVATQNGDIIRLLSDINDTSLTIGYNPGESGKHIILDLNGRNLTMNELNVTYSLMVKNGNMTAYINNGNSSGSYGALVVDGATLILPTGMQWLSDDGMQLKNGSYVELQTGRLNLTKLTMEENCIFSIN
mgnify:FL=1